MPLNVIHVGLGGWGGNWAQIAIPRVPEVDVVAVVDIDADTRASVLTAIKRPGLPGFA